MRSVLPFSSFVRLPAWLCAIALLAGAVPARASILLPATLPSLTAAADRVFRGGCISAAVEVIELAGGRIPVTVYTFQVSEYLKGEGSELLEFRQVGSPQGERRDLGRLAGLPVYRIGSEYLLFLLPESRARLTSPAGAATGAFLVTGDTVESLGMLSLQDETIRPGWKRGTGKAIHPGGPILYKTLRSAILKEVR